MAWVTAVLAFLKSVPDIIRFLMEVRKLVEQVKDAMERAERMKELKEAVAQARQSGDTSRLEAIFKGVGDAKPSPTP